MPNGLTFEQSAALLNNVVAQATGRAVEHYTIATPQDLVSVAQTALKTGFDPIVNAISQTLSKTIFSVRDYRAPLMGLMMEAPRFGNFTRKLSPVAMEMADDDSFKFPVAYDSTEADPYGTGESVDHYAINKQKVVQTNFYGSSVYQQNYTIFRKQLECAFSDANEFSQFFGMLMTERANDRESYREGLARTLQANFIGGILAEEAAGTSGRVIHLLTEYNSLTDQSLDITDIYAPDTFPAFMKWVYARVSTIVRMMGARSELFQTKLTGKTILRYTPANEIRVALYAPAMDQMRAMVLADTYNDNYLKYADFEAINYWQTITSPDRIRIKPVYTNASGAVTQPAVAVDTDGKPIFGLIHDKAAMGYAFVDEEAAVTPYNARGRYWNEYYHMTARAFSDNTEKGVVLMLD